jgi:CP family cyanate transporter-like MFS transporter
MVRTVWSYVICGAACFVGILVIVVFGGAWVIVGTTILGFSAAAILVLVLALPPLISPADDVHRVSAGMFTISYSCAVVVPVLSGALWDLTGMPAAAFIPMGICTLAVIGLAPGIVLREKRTPS